MTEFGSSRLPVELHEIIIDLLANNHHHLHSMALVCRFWRAKCHKTTYRTLRLNPSSIQSFRRLLSSSFSSTGIVEHVRHLWLGSHTTENWGHYQLSALRTVVCCLGSIGKLRSITILKSGGFLFQQDFASLLPFHLPSVTALHLSNVEFDHPGDFAHFFLGFPLLQHAVVKDVVPDSFSQFAISPGMTSAGWYSLSLHFGENATVQRSLRWSRKKAILPLAVDDIAFYNNPSTLLHAVGQSLSHIEIVAKSYYCECYRTCPNIPLEFVSVRDNAWGDPLHNIDLSSATALRHISAGSSTCVLSLMTWIPSLLRQIPESAPLRVLQIAFASSRQFHLDKAFIQCLVNILSRPQFRALEIIQFMAFGTLGDKEIENTISRTVIDAFGGWDKKGLKNIVRFTFSS